MPGYDCLDLGGPTFEEKEIDRLRAELSTDRKRCSSAERTLLRIDALFNDSHRASELVHEHFLKDFDDK